jgi:Uma2 family endonuclease
MVLQTPPQTRKPHIIWEKLPKDFVLPDDPVENIKQPFLAAALTDALGTANLITSEMLIASNFGLVAKVDGKTVVKAPDWLFVPKVDPVPEEVTRRSYTPHTEGEAVAIVMEFLSEDDQSEHSVRSTYPYGKLYFYERILQVPTYIIFDPEDSNMEVRRLQNEQYVFQAPDDQGRFWIPEINLFLGIWLGTRLGITTHWLRWWDESGNLLRWGAEKAEQEAARAEQEAARAEQEAARADAAEQELARLRSLLNQNPPA